MKIKKIFIEEKIPIKLETKVCVQLLVKDLKKCPNTDEALHRKSMLSVSRGRNALEALLVFRNLQSHLSRTASG